MSIRAYDFHGLRIAVASEDPSIGAAIDGRLRHFRVEEPAAAQWSYEIRIAAPDHHVGRPPGEGRVVYDPPVGEVLYFGDEDVLWIDVEDRVRVHAAPGRTLVSVRPDAVEELWLLSRPLFTIPFVEAAKRHGLFSLHASAAALDGRVLVMPGSTGAGKSTLAVALARGGWSFLADDMVFLTTDAAGLRVHGFPDEVDLSPESAAWFPELAAMAQPEAGWPKARVRLDEAIGATTLSGGTPAALAFPSPGSADASRDEPLSPAEALLELAPNVLLTSGPAAQAHLDALGELVRRAPAHRLATGRDFEALPERLARLVR